MTRPLIIVGASGHLRDLTFILESRPSEWDVAGVLDDNPDLHGKLCAGAVVLGDVRTWPSYADHWMLVAIGSPRVRRRVVLSMSGKNSPRFARAVHASAAISNSSVIGNGAMVGPHATISAEVHIGDHVIINAGATIAHEVRIGSFVTIAPQAALSGNVVVEDGVEIGTGALVRQGVRLGKGAMVGMGAVVLSDVPANSCVVGNPARLLRKLPEFGVFND